MSFRLQRQRGTLSSPVARWLVGILFVTIVAALTLDAPSISWSSFLHHAPMSMISVPAVELAPGTFSNPLTLPAAVPLSQSFLATALPSPVPALSLYNEPAAIPSTAAPIPQTVTLEPAAEPKEAPVRAGHRRRHMPAHETMERLNVPFHKYTLIFEGQAISNERVCAHAQIRLRINTGHHTVVARGRTDKSGFYSIPVQVNASPGWPIEWSLQATKPHFETLQLNGRRIAVNEDPSITILQPLELARR